MKNFLMTLSAAIDLIYRTVAKHTRWMQRHVAFANLVKRQTA